MNLWNYVPLLFSPGRQNSRIEGVFIHPDYDEPDRANDIALVKITDAADFNDNVSPICLPDQDDFGDDSSFGVGMNCYLSGKFLILILDFNKESKYSKLSTCIFSHY